MPKAPRSPKLRSATPAEWVTHVLANFDPFLLDHAACERKASAMAMSLVAHYPDRVQLVETMISFAREELEHFDQVVTLLHGRGLTLGKDSKDEYVQGLRGCIRTGRDAYFLDRLLVSGVVEARGCERFGLIAEALEPGSLKDFYREITSSEARHHGVFLRLARKYFEPDEADRREAEIFEFEAELMLSLPLRAAVH